MNMGENWGLLASCLLALPFDCCTSTKNQMYTLVCCKWWLKVIQAVCVNGYLLFIWHTYYSGKEVMGMIWNVGVSFQICRVIGQIFSLKCKKQPVSLITPIIPWSCSKSSQISFSSFFFFWRFWLILSNSLQIPTEKIGQSRSEDVQSQLDNRFVRKATFTTDQSASTVSNSCAKFKSLIETTCTLKNNNKKEKANI